MMDLRTRYLGLELESPLVPSASPLSRSLESARILEDAGAGALVMYSLFEEAIEQEQHLLGHYLQDQNIGHAEADSYLPLPHGLPSEADRYLEQLVRLKRHLAIPVVASLNGVHLQSWLDYGKELEAAGADALELNVYYIPANCSESGVDVERRYINLLRALKSEVTIPITLKLSSQFTAPGHFVRQLEGAGAAGVTLFNRFYQPDIDIDSLRVAPNLNLSTPAEALMTMRWMAILHGQVDLTLGAGTGVHSAEQVVKMLLAGADVVHMTSVLLQRGPAYLQQLRTGLEHWMEEKGFHALAQFHGTLSQKFVSDPNAYDRVQYVRMLESFRT